MMRYVLSVFIFLLLLSCRSETTAISESRRDAVVDSLVGVRMQEVVLHATEDLDRRRSIEVKAKADSIIAAQNDRRISGDSPVPNRQTEP